MNQRSGRRTAAPAALYASLLASAAVICCGSVHAAAKRPLAQAQAARAAEAGIVRFDFESGGLQGWRVVEGKFDFLVCNKRKFRNRPKVDYNKQGRWFLTTLELRNGRGNDRMTGVVESPVFVVRGPSARLLVGGGKHADTYAALCTLDGQEVLHARGRNTETMDRIEWDVRRFVGRRMFLRVVDRNRGGWGHVTLDDFRVQGEIDTATTKRRWAQGEQRRRLRAQLGAAGEVSAVVASLRAAVRDLTATFGRRYPRGREFLARLAELERRLASSDAEAIAKAGAELARLRREALIANPLVSRHPILFVVRHQYRKDHHNTATMFQTGEINARSFQGGGALRTIDLGRGGAVRTLAAVPNGVVRDCEVSFDGRKVLFSMRRDAGDDYHVYELEVSQAEAGRETARPRQLTFGSGLSDIDPMYLPDGRIVFASTREPKYCMCNRHIMCNLFRMAGDGANIHQIGHSTLHEGHPALLPDGRVLYDRWEYVDRNFGDAQGLWTCGPDGTNHAIYWGNNTPSPGGVLDARAIPGTERFVATFSSCHDRPWGALAVVDRARGLDGKAPVVRTWPADAIDLVMKGNYDTFKRVRPRYEDPFPLAEARTNAGAGRYFLCSRQADGEQMGIYLVDVFGNELLLHTEAPGCYDPMPLAPRTRPPAIPDRIRLDRKEGRFYLHDVYRGFGMERIERGRVKFLRVVESPEKRSWTRTAWQGSGTQAPGMAWDDFNNKRILGRVPVEPDGSAYVSVPADTWVYFQILDADGMMIQSMRSGTIVRPGETTGCVGCHEGKLTAVPNHRSASASRPPRALQPWHGPPRLFNYRAEVQPVFDRYCVRCHDFGKKGGGKLLLAGDLTQSFNVSYMELRRRGLVRVPGAGPAQTLAPVSWGSHASKLVHVLRKGHNDVKLDAESFDRIVTWIDINAPYYPRYASAYPGYKHGRCPLTKQELAQLGKLTGTRLGRQSREPQISFTRPECSPILAKLGERDRKRRRALEIIRAGARRLAERPRADMEGFRLIGIEAEREAKYRRRLELEKRMRRAIVRGERAYDPARRGPPGGS